LVVAWRAINQGDVAGAFAAVPAGAVRASSALLPAIVPGRYFPRITLDRWLTTIK
jgi:hypothetical protein